MRLRFNDESYGWEEQFFEGGELLAAHGAFVMREAAVRWAEPQRKMFER